MCRHQVLGFTGGAVSQHTLALVLRGRPDMRGMGSRVVTGARHQWVPLEQATLEATQAFRVLQVLGDTPIAGRRMGC